MTNYEKFFLYLLPKIWGQIMTKNQKRHLFRQNKLKTITIASIMLTYLTRLNLAQSYNQT